MSGPHGCCSDPHLEATFSIDALADSGEKFWLDAVRSCTPNVLMPRAFTASVAPRRTASVLLVAAPVLLLVPRSGRSWVSAPHLGAPTRTAAARRRGTKARTVVAVRMRRGPFCTVAFEAGKKIASASAPSAFSGCERTSAIHGRTGNGKNECLLYLRPRFAQPYTGSLFSELHSVEDQFQLVGTSHTADENFRRWSI